MHDAASKSEGRHSFCVTCCYAPGPHCTQSRTAHDIHENREQRFPTRHHPPWPRCMVRAYGRNSIEVTIKKVEIANY